MVWVFNEGRQQYMEFHDGKMREYEEPFPLFYKPFRSGEFVCIRIEDGEIVSAGVGIWLVSRDKWTDTKSKVPFQYTHWFP